MGLEDEVGVDVCGEIVSYELFFLASGNDRAFAPSGMPVAANK